MRFMKATHKLISKRYGIVFVAIFVTGRVTTCDDNVQMSSCMETCDIFQHKMKTERIVDHMGYGQRIDAQAGRD